MNSRKKYEKMANLKSHSILVGLILIFSGMNQHVSAAGTLFETPPQTILDFWLSFGELLTEDLLTKLTQVQLPSIALPSLPTLPSIPSLPSLPSLPSIPNMPPAPHGSNVIPIQVQLPNPNGGAPQTRIIYIPNPSHHAAAPSPPASPSSPPTCNCPAQNCGCGAPRPNCEGGKCKPENVKIVVIDDCNEHKSESESEEQPIEVYQRKGRRPSCKYNRH